MQTEVHKKGFYDKEGSLLNFQELNRFVAFYWNISSRFKP